MALFGKVDASLPLITQIVQIDTNDADELLAFWFRVAAHAQANYVNHYSRESNVEVEHQDPDGVMVGDDGEVYFPVTPVQLIHFAELDVREKADLFWEGNLLALQAEAEGYPNTKTYMLDRFKYACEAVQGISATLQERGAVPIGKLQYLRNKYDTPKELMPDVTRLIERANLTAADMADLTPEETGVYLDRVEMPLAEFVPPSYLGTSDPSFYVASEMEALLTSLWRNKARLLICAECNNIFVAHRKGQKYCSHRCGTRVTMRRKRQQKQ